MEKNHPSRRSNIMRYTLRSIVAAGALALAGGSFACAPERDTVDRVQANAIPKSMFVRQNPDGSWSDNSDSWYFRATVVDAPAANAVPAYIGTASTMYRVKWKIEEKYLLAYNENPDIIGTADSHGGVVAAFPITSHFDIKKSYNTVTGEETNVIEENTSDRPWYMRDYIRVDWSTNKLSEAAFVFPAYESISAATYYVQDPNNYDHPTFEKDYFDITAHYTVEATPSTCYYLHREAGCGPGDVAARLSFMKVPTREFVPRDYPDRVQLLNAEGTDYIRSPSGTPVTLPMNDQHGIFRVQRPVYDARYGALESKYIYRARIWNIWQEWFKKDAGGKQTICAKDGSCGEPGPTTFIYQSLPNSGDPDYAKPVLIPYNQRKVRPIRYFLNADWPAELHDVARDIAGGWNDAFQETVAALRLLEKKGAGTTVTYDELRAEVKAMKDRNENVFVLCENNPVKKGDPEICGPEGTIARLGDQRYSFMYWINKPQPTGPLGLGPSYSDPITGELISAGAHLYGAALDTASQFGVDVVNLLSGRFKENDYINGVHTDLYAKRLMAGDVPGPKPGAFMDKEIPAFPGEPGFDLGKMQAHVDKVVDKAQVSAIGAKGLPKAEGMSGADRLAMIRGTPLERMLFDVPELKLLAGKGPDEKLSDADLSAIGKQLLSKSTLDDEHVRNRFLGEHDCFYPVDFADDGMIGFARQMAAKYPKSADPKTEEQNQRNIWMEIRKLYLLQVEQHEVGHTLGMAHNFEGSADPVNFFDEYWKLRCNTGTDCGSGKTQIKYGVALTEDQKNKRMAEYQYSTVMDYTSRWNSEVQGLGKYDYQTIRFAYGNMVETWPKGKLVDPLYQIDKTFNYSLSYGAQISQSFTGYSAELLDGINRTFRHYTQIPGMFTDGVVSLGRSRRELRRYDEVVKAARALYLEAGKDNLNAVKTGAWKKAADPDKQIDVVPYRWCGDIFAGSAGRPLCERWDTGMDPYEVVQDAIGRYRDYYVFEAFSRGKVDGYNRLRGYLSRVVTRYFEHVHLQYISWLFNSYYRSTWLWPLIDGRLGGGTGGQAVKNGWLSNGDWYQDPGGGLPVTLATNWGLDRLVDVLAVPDVGVYTDGTTGFLSQVARSPWSCGTSGSELCVSDDKQLALDIDGGARYARTTYELTSTYDPMVGPARVTGVGSYYDKLAAMIVLSSTDASFIGQDTTNALSYRIGFYLAFPRGISTVVGGIVNEHLDNYAWRYEFDSATKKPSLLSADIFVGEKTPSAGFDPIPKRDGLKGKAIRADWPRFYKEMTLYYSMSQFQNNFSQSWNDAVRVFCLGCGEAFTPSTGMVSFVDPLSGKQYAAAVYGDGRYSPGAEIVRKGDDLAKAYTTAKALPTSDPTREAKLAAATTDLQEHLKLIDLIRSLYAVYGYTRF